MPDVRFLTTNPSPIGGKGLLMKILGIINVPLNISSDGKNMTSHGVWVGEGYIH